jgi:hypothetical protein
MNILLLGIPLAVGILGGFASLAQEDARQKALQAVFDDLEKGLKSPDEALFKGRWHAEGYEKNLCGGSGLAGSAVFGQGSRKKWFLKPDFAQTVSLGEGAALIVPCQVWAWEKEKAVDKVDMLLVKETDGWKLLGGGEKRVQVEALANRWLKKEPLEAPKEKE